MQENLLDEKLIDKCWSHYLAIQLVLKHNYSVETKQKYFPDIKILSRNEFATEKFGEHTVFAGQLLWKDFKDRHNII